MIICSENEILDLVPNQDISVSISNPFFESDRVSVAISTPIEFKATETTRRMFQYVPGPMMKPLRRKLPAVFIEGGIPLWVGELQRDELSDQTGLHYTFVGAEFEDIVSGNLTDIVFNSYQNVNFPQMVDNARKGFNPEFGLPMIIRKTFAAKNEYRTSTNKTAYPECSATDKYANWLHATHPYFVPALKVRYMLEKLLPGLYVESREVAILLNYLAILGLHKNKKQDNRFGIEPTIPGLPIFTGTCNLDLADTLPEMSAKDFILNFLKMTCSTLYCSGKDFVIRSNRSILTSPQHVDWTEKASDVYSVTDEEGQSYTFKFQNDPDNYAKKYSDEPDRVPEDDNIPECNNMMDVLTKMELAGDYITVKHKHTGDVYTGKKINAFLYYHWQSHAWYDFPTVIPALDIVHQAGFEQKEVKAGVKAQNYDCSIDFEVPRCIPTSVYTTEATDGKVIYATVGKCAVCPIVEFPTLGDTRPTTVYIGLLMGNNFVDKGIYFTHPITHEDPGSEVSEDVSLAINGQNGLYETLHKPFAEWLKKDKDPRKVELKLTPGDIVSLKLWSKYMFSNQLFFIRNLDFTFNTSSGKIETSAEIIEA